MRRASGLSGWRGGQQLRPVLPAAWAPAARLEPYPPAVLHELGVEPAISGVPNLRVGVGAMAWERESRQPGGGGNGSGGRRRRSQLPRSLPLASSKKMPYSSGEMGFRSASDTVMEAFQASPSPSGSALSRCGPEAVSIAPAAAISGSSTSTEAPSRPMACRRCERGSSSAPQAPTQRPGGADGKKTMAIARQAGMMSRRRLPAWAAPAHGRPASLCRSEVLVASTMCLRRHGMVETHR